MTQTAFTFNRAPVVSDQAVARLIEALDNAGWRTAKQLRDLGTERQLRAWASASEGRIISGQQGYKATLEATPEEMNEFIGRMASQENEMKRRRMETEQCWHRRQTEAA